MSDVVPFGTTFLPYLHLKFHFKQHFYIFLVIDSIRLFANSETNETAIRHFSSSFVACPVIIQKNAF